MSDGRRTSSGQDFGNGAGERKIGMNGWTAPRSRQKDGFSLHGLTGGRHRRVVELYLSCMRVFGPYLTLGVTAFGGLAIIASIRHTLVEERAT